MSLLEYKKKIYFSFFAVVFSGICLKYGCRYLAEIRAAIISWDSYHPTSSNVKQAISVCL